MKEDMDAAMAGADYAGPIHASSVVIDGNAVLLCGTSGVGKSDLALRLIDRGAILLCDDYTHIARERDVLIGRPPAEIAGLLEVRGIGLIRLPHIVEAPIALIVHLLDPNTPQPERMPDALPKRTLCGVDLDVLSLHAFEASTPLKIELTLRKHLGQTAFMEPM